MVWAGRVSWSRSDTAVPLFDESVVIQSLIGCVPPKLCPHASVKVLSKGLCQPVCEGLKHDRIVVIVRRFKRFHAFVNAVPCGYTETADVVGWAALWGDEVRQ